MQTLRLLGIFLTGILSFAKPIEASVLEAQCKYLPTYFSYTSEEIEELGQLDFTKTMSKEELVKWDDIIADLFDKHPNVDSYRLYAYLYTAQKEAAFLSYNAHGYFVGSIAPISIKVLTLFFTESLKIDSDPYSEKLAEIVFSKIKNRFEAENREIREFPISSDDPKLKDFLKPHRGLKRASYTPWILSDPKEFMALPLCQNDLFWINQAEIVKQYSDNCSREQIEIAKFWAGESDKKGSNLRVIANAYMFCHDIPFSKLVYVRALLEQAEIDVDIALFYSKYSYLIKRPWMVNPKIVPHVEQPHHPSYPSGHSTSSSAWATLLSYFFPENQDRWSFLAKEAGESRIFAGVHFPIDHEQGSALGIKLGNAILERSCF